MNDRTDTVGEDEAVSEREARALAVAHHRQRGNPMADEPMRARRFRGGWFLAPEGPTARASVGSRGLVVTDDRRIHVVGSMVPVGWAMARHLSDDGPDRRSEADATLAARRYGDAEGGDLAGRHWVGTRFAGGWLLVPREQFERPPVRAGDGIGVVVFDDGDIHRVAVDRPIDLEAARLAAELHFGDDQPA